ncbi:MAG: hypothetical protein SNH13_03860 [Rikenellaceae bacterium]
MKSLLVIVFVFISTLLSHAAESEAQEAVAAMQKSIESMGSYSATVRVRPKGAAASVSLQYSVSGDSYYMSMPRYEIYGEGSTRYEVNNKSKEIIIAKSKGLSDDMLSNPAQSLKLLWSNFNAEMISKSDKEWSVRLTPKSTIEGLVIDRALLDISRVTKLPVKLIYEAGDDRAIIRFDAIKPLSSPIPRFDRSKFEEYDIFDF